MTPDATLYILEPYWDRQRHETAAFCLQQTSLYFTCIANGNSQMYAATDMLRCINGSGLHVVEDRNEVRVKAQATGNWPPSALAKKTGLPGYEIVKQENRILAPASFSPIQ